MTLTPSGQIAAVIAGVIGGAILAGKGNRYLGAIGGGTLGLVVPYVIFPPTDTTTTTTSSVSSTRAPPVVVGPTQVDPNNPNNNQNNSS